MGIMLGAGAWPTEARRSGWMCASASSLASTGRATSCDVAARTSYPFGGRDGGPRGSRALGLGEADDGDGSWFWRSSSCARKCCSVEGAELVLARTAAPREDREDHEDQQQAQDDKKRKVWMHA